MSRYFPVEPIRAALRDLKRSTAETGSSAPSWDRILTVRDHEGALDPTRPVVIGDRGTGKSFWTGALSDDRNRERLAKVYSRLDLGNLDVRLGFGADEFSAEHPTSNELVSLLKADFSTDAIWRAVTLSLLPPEIRPEPMRGPWEARVRWVLETPSLRRDEFLSADRYFVEQKRRFLVIFDALDTMASSWEDIAALMRGLLQLGLFLRSARGLKVKLFLRPDMADDPTLWAVGDSSKLRHDEVSLTWSRRDLHALLSQFLANDARTREILNSYTQQRFGHPLQQESERFIVPEELTVNEAEQQRLFANIAGDYMGKGPTKGRTYTWVPNHLANARGFSAPRSFLLALSVAAEASKSADTALDVQGIQEGVRQASQSRIRELREDYRWIDAVFRPLRDSTVPMDRRDIVYRWRTEGVIKTINKEVQQDTTGRYLPPPRVGAQSDDPSTHAALLETLDHLGIVETTGDGRINMPDLFRLAAGVKRMGGVKLRP